MLRRAVLRLAHGALAPERTAVCWRLPPVRCLADSPARVEPSAPQPAVRRPEPARGVGQAGAARQRALKISELLTKARSPVQVLEVVGSARADFNSINLATALHRIAKLTAAQPSAERRTFFHAHDERMRRLVADIHAELPRFPGRQLAACAYAASLICHGPSQPLRDDVRLLLRAIGPLAVRHVPDLHSQGLANLAWAHAQADMHAPELFDALTPVALRRLPEFSIEGLSALAWAYAKLGLPEPALVRALGRQVVGRLAAREGPHDRPARAERTSPREITNLAWSLSRLAGPSEELRGAFDALAADALRQLQHFHPRDLSQLVWTYARARHAAPELFERVAALALPRLSQFNSQDFANMASAYAIAGVDADWLFRAVALEVEPRLHEFTPQGLANLAWAFSKAGTPSARVLLESIATVFPARLPELGARHLAMLVWAFAKSGVYPEAPFRAVETELGARNLSGFNHIELVNTAWAFATARVAAPALLELIGAELLPRLGQLEPQPLANIAWSLARSRTPAHAVFRAICDEVERRPLHTFSAQNQANLAWAFAVAGCEGPRLAAALAPEIVSRAAEFKGAELANLAWALSVCRALGSAQLAPASRRQLAGALLQRIELLRDAPECELGGPEALSQLHQANMALQLEAPELGLSLSPAMGARCARAMSSLGLSHPELSARHASVSAALGRLGHAHANEQLLPGLGYRVDIALSGRSVVLEVAGQASHDAQREPVPSYAMKARHMRLAGWAVVEVPFWEWPDDLAGQEAYLAAKLDLLPPAPRDAQWGAAGADSAAAPSAALAGSLGGMLAASHPNGDRQLHAASASGGAKLDGDPLHARR